MLDLYEMIFKRKSFHFFNNIDNKKLTQEELDDINSFFSKVIPLNKNIKIKLLIDKDNNTCARGQEYCILMYSEVKENYLQNIGYIGEQIDLYLASKNIASLWFGIGKVTEIVIDNLNYVIMIAISKTTDEHFRKDMFKSKRKNIEDIWQGNHYLDIANIVRFAPSACNSQPWFVISKEDEINIYRYKQGKRGIMPKEKVDYYNQIDIGIFLYFLELCLNHNNIQYERLLHLENPKDDTLALNATYLIK